MPAILLWSILAAAPLGTNVSLPPGSTPRDRAAFEQCQPRIKARAGGEISEFTVTGVRRWGRSTTVRGKLTVLQRPPAGGPGTMTPTHILAAPYRFRCVLRGGSVRAVSVSPVAG